MLNTKYGFEKELEKLLKEYLEDEDFQTFDLCSRNNIKPGDSVSEKINDFYREQLNITVNSCSDRIKIDRTITYSEKKLSTEKFCEFLMDLGKLCLTSGRLSLSAEIFKKANSKAISYKIKADSLLAMADVFSRRSNWKKAVELASEAEGVYKKSFDNIGIARCNNLIGSVYGETGEVEKAEEYFLKCLSLLKPGDEPELTGNIENNLGIIESMRSNFIDSIVHFNKALNIYDKLSNKKFLAHITFNMGMVYYNAGGFESAIASFDEGIKIARDERFMLLLALFYLAKAQALVSMDALYYAAEFADKALEISNSVEDKLTLADVYKVKGIIERHLKNYKISENYFLTSLRLNTALKNEMNIAETSFELGVLYNEINNSESKESYLKNSLSYFKKINAWVKIRKIEEMLDYKAA